MRSTDSGFDLPRSFLADDAYITALRSSTRPGERWPANRSKERSKFHELFDWQADPAEREAERGARRRSGPEHVASISSQLKNFRIDLKNIVGAAQHTIASDTRRFQTETASLFETQLRSIRLWLTISPWLIAGMVLTGIALMMAASFFWTVHLTALGADGTGPDSDRTARGDLADPGPVEDASPDLHDGRAARDLYHGSRRTR